MNQVGCSPKVAIVFRQVTNMVKIAQQSNKAEFCRKVSKFLRYLKENR